MSTLSEEVERVYGTMDTSAMELHESKSSQPKDSAAVQLRSYITSILPPETDSQSIFDAKVRTKGLSLVQEKKYVELIHSSCAVSFAMSITISLFSLDSNHTDVLR